MYCKLCNHFVILFSDVSTTSCLVQANFNNINKNMIFIMVKKERQSLLLLLIIVLFLFFS